MSPTRRQIPALLPAADDDYPFPPVALALREPNGLLALGGSLRPRRLLGAYKQGIFPWYSADQPILWWSPDPRLVLFPEKLVVHRSLRKAMRNRGFQFTLNQSFASVVDACAQARPSQPGTWITPEIRAAYLLLHHQGYAHSAEVWRDGDLVGGLYGVTLGKVFFGESMFARERDASKVAFVTLVEKLRAWGYQLIDCQVATQHLTSLGAEEIPRPEFCALLRELTEQNPDSHAWK